MDPEIQNWIESFDEHVWPLCWRLVSRKAALKAWLKITPKDAATFNAVCDGMERHGKTYREREPEKRPHLATYLNSERWKDPDA